MSLDAITTQFLNVTTRELSVTSSGVPGQNLRYLTKHYQEDLAVKSGMHLYAVIRSIDHTHTLSLSSYCSCLFLALTHNFFNPFGFFVSREREGQMRYGLHGHWHRFKCRVYPRMGWKYKRFTDPS